MPILTLFFETPLSVQVAFPKSADLTIIIKMTVSIAITGILCFVPLFYA